MPDGYTHDPGALREEEDEAVADPEAGSVADPESGRVADPEADPAADTQGAHPESVEREFDWRGWTLVAAIVVAFLVVPGIIYLYPRVGTTFGLSFWDAYLALPMVPAVILGILAVWATTRP